MAETVELAHGTFIKLANAQLNEGVKKGAAMPGAAASDKELTTDDLVEDLWVKDLNYRISTGALHDVFVETRETFAHILQEYQKAEAERRGAAQVRGLRVLG